MTTPRVAPGAVVSVTYTMHGEDGALLEQVDIPVSYVHGASGPLLPLIEQALDGLAVGAAVTVTLAPEEGFGPHDPGLEFTDDVENVPEELRQIGERFTAEGPDGRELSFVVTRIANGRLTVDANHPFAGRTLSCTVRVVELREATPAERQSGIPDTPGPRLQ